MKNLKLYEDLIKDLYDLGISEDRCQIKITLERSKGDFETPIIISFPSLNKEGKITKEKVNDLMIEGEYEIEFDKAKSERYRKNIRKEIEVSISRTARVNKNIVLKKTMEYIIGWYSLPAEAKLIIDDKVIMKDRNLSSNFWGRKI